jgi:hypothetical protein
VNDLELLSDLRMVGSSGHAMLFRQRFGNLPATHDGLISVAVLDDKVVYVSSTHLRLVAITNQCMGGPAFQGDQDNDPLNNSDCTTDASTTANMIRVAEIEAFSSTNGQ